MTNEDIFRLLLIILLFKNGNNEVSSVNEVVITALLLSSCSNSNTNSQNENGCGCNSSF